jgi:pimeloyl-ACP methyl ester carboxylesterase
VIVGQSYGAFTATLAASRLPTRLLVLLAGMIPVPGESPSEWWSNVGYRQAAGEQARLDGGKTGHDDPLISFDQFFPAAFMRRLAQQRLGTVADEVPGCHCAALSHPRELSDLLVSYLD